MWDLPRPGLEPVFPALAGRFSTTVPPGKPGGEITVSLFVLGQHDLVVPLFKRWNLFYSALNLSLAMEINLTSRIGQK